MSQSSSKKTPKTEFVAWMDADDISLEDRLQTQMDFLKQNSKIDAVGIQYSTFGSSGNLPNDFTSNFAPSDIEIKTDFVFGYNFLFGGSLMRMKKIKQHHLFFDNNYIFNIRNFYGYSCIEKIIYYALLSYLLAQNSYHSSHNFFAKLFTLR